MPSRALSNAVSGLQASDLWLDVIGNNVSNVNTIGYKASRVTFQERFSQTLFPASPSSDLSGGVNAAQAGTGTRVQSIQANFTQGALQNTGRAMDLALDGDGFLLIRSGNQTYLTRAGNLSFDAEGYLVDDQGGYVQGYNAAYQVADKMLATVSNIPGQPLLVHQAKWVLPNSGTSALTSIQIPNDMTLPPKATTEVKFQGNLDAAQKATAPGGVLDLGTFAQPVLPIAINLGYFGPVWATDSTRLTYTTLANGDYAIQQVANLSTTMAYPITNGMIPVSAVRNWGSGSFAWEQNPPIQAASTATSTVYDSTGAQHQITVLFYQVNDLGDGGVNNPDGPNQAVYAWYAFDTTGGIQPKTSNILGGTGIIEGDNIPETGQWYYDRAHVGDLYAGDFLWFNTDGSLASTGGSGGPVPTPPGMPNYMTIPRVYLPATNSNPPVSPFPTQGADILAVDLDFGTGGLIGTGQRDGLTGDAAGSYQTVNGVSTYVPSNTAHASSQDGYPEGRLENVSWGTDGVLNGEFSNGQMLAVARVGIARVENNDGLRQVGGNRYAQTANSGALIVGAGAQNGLAAVRGGFLENSNVDLATELTSMIVAQRGFDANARVIQVADAIEKTRLSLGR